MLKVILYCDCPTCVDSPREDPSSGGDGSFDQAFAKHLLEFRLQVEVLKASVYRDEQGGQLQLPVLYHQMQQVVRFGVIGDSNILGEKRREKHSCDLYSIKPDSHFVCFNFFMLQVAFPYLSPVCMHVSKPHHGLVDEAATLELD